MKLAVVGSSGPQRSVWRLAPRAKIPGRPPGANVVTLGAFRGKPSRILVSGFFSYPRVELHSLIARVPRTLVSPFLLEAVPCARQPTVQYGVGQPGTLLVDWAYSPLADPTSPFGALPDLFEFRRLSLFDSKNAPYQVRIFQLVLRPGDALLPVART